MDGRIHIRIPEDLKEAFLRACDKKAVNPSKLIRKWIEEYIKPDYCTQDALTCETCSLTNYRRDCQNNPID